MPRAKCCLPIETQAKKGPNFSPAKFILDHSDNQLQNGPPVTSLGHQVVWNWLARPRQSDWRKNVNKVAGALKYSKQRIYCCKRQDSCRWRLKEEGEARNHNVAAPQDEVQDDTGQPLFPRALEARVGCATAILLSLLSLLIKFSSHFGASTTWALPGFSWR